MGAFGIRKRLGNPVAPIAIAPPQVVKNMANPGDIVMNAGQNPPPGGWLACDGAIYKISMYPQLYNVIQHYYTDAAAAGGNIFFRVPDMRSMSPMCSSAMPQGPNNSGSSLPQYPPNNFAARFMCDQYGADSVQIASDNLPEHLHAILDSGHTHTATDSGHTHGVNDPGHSHTVNNFVNSAAGTEYVGAAGTKGTIVTATGPQFTGETIASATANITNTSALTGINATAINITAKTKTPIVHPVLAIQFWIKT